MSEFEIKDTETKITPDKKGNMIDMNNYAVLAKNTERPLFCHNHILISFSFLRDQIVDVRIVMG